MALAVMDLDGLLCYDTSANMWPTHESSHDVGKIVISVQFQPTLLTSWQHVKTCCQHFQLSLVVMVLQGDLAELMAAVAPEIYQKYITYCKDGKAIL